MKNVLYIGNNLKSKSANVSSIQTLGSLFEKEGFKVNYRSSIENRVLRLIDMVVGVCYYRNKLDYVLIDTYSTLNFYFALVISQLCRLLKLKYIPNLNGGNLPARLQKHPKMCKLIFNNAHVNVSPSYYLKDQFNKEGYSNVAYIPNTIELKNYQFRKRTFSSIKLLWVRSFSQIYNPKLAVKVVKRLHELNFKAELCMVGPDSDGTLKQVKKLAKELKVDVKFTGKLKKSEWADLSKNYNIFINTTNFDNMPVSVIEAMALGLPVVSTNVGGIPYLIQDHHDGILVEKDNVDAMVQAVLNISLNEGFGNKLAVNARSKVEQFDWNIVKNKWFEILQ